MNQTNDERLAEFYRPAYPTGTVDRRHQGVSYGYLDPALKVPEKDPHGKSQHEAGAKVDAGKVRMHLITGGMARAITEVAKVGTMGAAKYTDGGWVSVPDGFRRYEDAQQRHAAYRHMGEEMDPESHLPHLAHEAWNALAKLDLYIREREAREQASRKVA